MANLSGNYDSYGSSSGYIDNNSRGNKIDYYNNEYSAENDENSNRTIFFIFLLLVAIGVGIGIYFATKRESYVKIDDERQKRLKKN